jgi:glycosyltransferase involved in cell wall biosynthesis
LTVKIAFVTHAFFPRYYAGVERLTLNLAEQLRRMGHGVVVVTAAEYASGGAAPYSVNGTLVRPVPSARVDVQRPWESEPKTGAALGRTFDEEGVELVHIMQPLHLPQASREARRRALPVVAHIADFYYLCARTIMVRKDGSVCTGAEGGRACAAICDIRSGVERIAWGRDELARADAVVSPCRFTIDVFASQGFATAAWHHVPGGVDYSVHRVRLPAPDRGGLTLGFLGTLLPHKGVDVAIEAVVRRLSDRDVRLVIYGESFHERAYADGLRRLAGGDPRIVFAGAYDHEDFRSILAPLDAVVIPSVWHENMPTTGLNAVAAGVPLLASDVGGLRELVDGYSCGFTFRVGDSCSLATLLERLCSESSLLRDVRQRMAFPPSVEEEAWAIESIHSDSARRHCPRTNSEAHLGSVT